MVYRPRFGLSVSYNGSARPTEYLAQLRRFGFTAIELHLPYIDRFRSEIHVLADELESLTCHLPWRGELEVLTDDSSQEGRVIERLKVPFDKAASVGCRTFTFHVTNVVGQKIDEYWQRSVDFARKLDVLARQFDAVVGVENCYPVVRSAYFARKFLDEVDADRLGMTLDTGHFWSAMCETEVGRHYDSDLTGTPDGVRVMNEMVCAMARAVGKKIFNIHIHNIRARDWKDHQSVDRGVMQYEPFFAILREFGYDRTVIVEHGSSGGWDDFEASARYLQRHQARP